MLKEEKVAYGWLNPHDAAVYGSEDPSTKTAFSFTGSGDFYEMFFDDALTASPGAGADPYGPGLRPAASARPCAACPITRWKPIWTRLIEKGYKVAICEQMEDPALAKGLVQRDVIRGGNPWHGD